ncbi:unnamed protein product [Ambrosiozyma monospora]|uniref:Unnamed protein product n=1 Tax=Ambrosiozyma monospora TaxID=43982 RepID=A0A9W7DHN0_AMBMO|nr:unnamed protein product [Ambrosiozyma monospora]
MTETSTSTSTPAYVFKTEKLIDYDDSDEDSDYYSALEEQDVSEMTSNTTQSVADDTGITKDTSGSDLKGSFKDSARIKGNENDSVHGETKDNIGSGSFKYNDKMKGNLIDVVHGGKTAGDSKFECLEVGPHKCFFWKAAQPPGYATEIYGERSLWMENIFRELKLS